MTTLESLCKNEYESTVLEKDKNKVFEFWHQKKKTSIEVVKCHGGTSIFLLSERINKKNLKQ